MDDRTPPTRPADRPAEQPHARRRPYQPPAIVSETKLEARAGSPIGPLLDPINLPNDYGL